jgi:Sulfotransferase domain
MLLKVIGAGLGRTGTLSLKIALEQLGFGRCHHMREVRETPGQLAYRQAAAGGDLPDWGAVFEAFGCTVDWPSARYWREIAARYPKAKVVLSVRPEQSWLRSMQATIAPLLRSHRTLPPGIFRDTMEMAHAIIAAQTFGGRLDDPEHMLAVYRAHNEEVRRTIAPDRLLVFDVAEGWAPLCAFLEVPVPDTPFPRANSTQEFQERVAAAGRA